MKKSQLIFLLFSFFSSFSVYAGWNDQCLDDCFSTHHDCKFCAYQCYSEDSYHPTPNYQHTPCPLNRYKGYQDNEDNN